MTNGTSVLWKILSGLVKKWPEMVAKWTPVTTRLGVTVFIARLNTYFVNFVFPIITGYLGWTKSSSMLVYLLIIQGKTGNLKNKHGIILLHSKIESS